MKRNVELKVKLSKKEKEILQRKASVLGLKLGAYIRLYSLNVNLKNE